MAVEEDRVVASPKILSNPVATSNLRFIVQHCIVSEPTKMVVFEASRTPTWTFVGQNGEKEYTKNDKGFFALLGSVLGASNMRMLLDHKAQIGYRIVERVVILSYEDELNVPGCEKARSMMFVLSSRRQPPTWIGRLVFKSGRPRRYTPTLS